MLTNKHLAVMSIRRVIFHDVPNHLKGEAGNLVLASAETEIDTPRRNMLKKKLIRVLDAKASYPILFASDKGSPIPMPNHKKKRDYSLKEIDLFAAYVIPEDAWYLIPAVLLLGARRRFMAALCPVSPPAKKASYCYECYREAWNLLTKSRSKLAQGNLAGSPFRPLRSR